MKCLIDADLISHEVSVCGQFIDEESGELVVRDFEFVAELADQRIKEIESEVWATEPSRLYFTGDRRLNKLKNKVLKREGKEEELYVDNFRFEVAKKAEYKGNRKSAKPFHFHNLRAYLMANYEYVVAVGMEADDLLCIDLLKDGDNLSVVCCSRDKDLRMVPGLHFGWAVGKQAQWGPRRVTEIGDLQLKTPSKVIGTGLKFFYSQIITGDPTDNIPGCPGKGPSAAYKLLSNAETEGELFERVAQLYKDKYGEDWRTEMKEQADLVWMIRELNEDGTPKRHVLYDERDQDNTQCVAA